jgi:aspartyl-tRNA(Asn)/glutamyl-tRNA(Gln) amidotransferase subunit B
LTDYEAVIGLEVHSQLLTASKMFCSCISGYQDAEPNTTVCEVCLGMPGVLPVINRRAVELVIATGLALGCSIGAYTKFDRKNYPYPDLMKGYQISQFDQPVASNGHLDVTTDGVETTVRINRVHLEEDTARLLHRNGSGDAYTLLDANRAGVPLMEIVTEPDISSPAEARAYLTSLHTILRFIGVSTANMEEGNFRCDANVSIRPVGDQELGSKVEVKNMNSFRSVFGALEFEIVRQTALARDGVRIVQETRGWIDDKEITVSQRSKEYASDYRYFPEPDLPQLAIDRALVDGIREALPELPQAKKMRYMEELGLSDYDAGLLTVSKATAEFFESALASSPAGGAQKKRAKAIGNWTLTELARLDNAPGEPAVEGGVDPAHLAELLDMIDSEKLSTSMAKTVFEAMYATGEAPGRIAEKGGMAQISDSDSITPAIEEAIDKNPGPVADYLGGKDAVIKFLVGQVMKITRDQANPQLVTTLLEDKLKAMR